MIWLRSLVLVVLLSGACVPLLERSEPAHRTTSAPPPAPSPTRPPHCHPFPDRIYDSFLSAYNGRNDLRLGGIVATGQIYDIVAAAYAGSATFDGVNEWTDAVWGARDRLRSAGYGAFSGGPRSFAMLLERRSPLLRAAGIEIVSAAFSADTEGCTITALRQAGPVIAKGDPCGFYDAFSDVPVIAAKTPRGCRDGSFVHSRIGHGAMWTGTEMLVWGGYRGGNFVYPDRPEVGLRLDVAAGRWRSLPASEGVPTNSSAVVWTGDEMFVLGPLRGRRGLHAAVFDPRGDRWRMLATPPFSHYRSPTLVSTGRQVIAWGGDDAKDGIPRRGWVYDLEGDTWSKTAPAPVGGRYDHSAVWTGNEMVVWGGGNHETDLADGAAYDPATDSWRVIAPVSLRPRQWFPMVWTGSEVILWGGSSYSRAVGTGAAYDPATDTWRKLPSAPIRRRMWHTATWTGTQVVVYGGYDGKKPIGTAAAYDPASDSWSRLPHVPVKPRCHHSAIFTGRKLIVFGGHGACGSGGHFAYGDAAIFDTRSRGWTRVVPNLRTGS